METLSVKKELLVYAMIKAQFRNKNWAQSAQLLLLKLVNGPVVKAPL